MKKHLLLVIFIALGLSFNSCKKNDGDPEQEVDLSGGISTPNGKTCLLTKAGGADHHNTFEYDDQKRVTKVKYFEDNIQEGYVTLSYGSNQIVFKEFDGTSTQADETITYTLNNGVVNSSSETYTTQENGQTVTVTVNYTYEHNSEGYLTKQTEVSKQSNQNLATTTVTTYTYQNGNLTQEVETSGNFTYTTSYEYYTDIANTLMVDEDQFLLSKPNKNALKKRTILNSNPGSIPSVVNYTYEVNSDKLITKKTRTEVSGTQTFTDINIYQYNCN
jgi:hypothetical protein